MVVLRNLRVVVLVCRCLFSVWLVRVWLVWFWCCWVWLCVVCICLCIVLLFLFSVLCSRLLLGRVGIFMCRLMWLSSWLLSLFW